MTRGSTSLLCGALLLVTGCNSTRIHWRPSFADQVPNGTTVRFYETGTPRHLVESIWYGRAVDWNTATPRIVTARGDTLTVPARARLEVLLPEKRNRIKAGALIGWIVGVIPSTTTCGFKRGCGENDFSPALGFLLGSLVGALIHTDEWVPVQIGP